MEVNEARRLKSLEDENARLKRLVADLTLDKMALQDALSDIVLLRAGQEAKSVTGARLYVA
jgi:putative transposase